MPDDAGLPHELPPISRRCPHGDRERTFIECGEIWQLCEACYELRLQAWKQRQDEQMAAFAIGVAN